MISPAFPSASPSAGRPLGALRFSLLARAARVPAYALGGVDAHTIRRLQLGPAIGVAMIGGLLDQAPGEKA